MAIFVVQVRTGKEEKAQDFLQSEFPFDGHFFFPRRKVRERKKGKTTIFTKALYPGYLFYEAETLNTDIAQKIFRDDLTYSFLKRQHTYLSLNEEERSFILRIKMENNTLDAIPIQFDVNQRVKIVSGPFQDQDTNVISIDRRKKKLKLNITMFNRVLPLNVDYREIQANA